MTVDEKQTNDLEQNEQLMNGEQESTEATFADMLKEYDVEPLHRGQMVEGEILKIEENVMFVDVGAKRTAVIPPDDLEQVDEEILKSISVGDKAHFFILRTPVGEEELLVSLQKGLERQDWIKAEQYLENQEMLELEIVGHNKGGLLVKFGNLRGFIPNSHVPDLQHIHDRRQLTSAKSKMVGEKLPLKVIEVDQDRRRLVLSMKAAQKEVRERRLRELNVGEVVEGRVASIVDFGAFVDLGGVDGLVHISNLAWRQVGHPSEVLKEGEEIEVLIESVDVERERVSLNRKVLLPNPWEEFAEQHEEGELIEGVVTKVVEFGAFVQVSPGIEGLVHVSEIRIYGSGDPKDVLQTGDVLLVRILSIDPDRERLGLSQRRVGMQEEMEWMQRRPTPPEMLEEEETAVADDSDAAVEAETDAADKTAVADEAVDEVEAEAEAEADAAEPAAEADEETDADEADATDADTDADAEVDTDDAETDEDEGESASE